VSDGDVSDNDASDDTVVDPADRRNTGERRLDRKFELTEAIILAIATVFTAWAAFQATKWSGVQANSYSAASASRTVASRAADVAATQVNIDVGSFNGWLSAVNDEQTRGEQPIAEDGTYVPDRDLLSGFLYERFSEEMLPAFDSWITTDPFTDENAPKTPFDMEEYTLEAITTMQELDKSADEQAATARDANQRGDNYVMVTVLLASVLFFAGIGSKMDTMRARVLLLTLALVVLTAGIVLVATMPVEI
jgi:hypothetical protein